MLEFTLKLLLAVWLVAEFCLFITGSDKGVFNWILDKLGV